MAEENPIKAFVAALNEQKENMAKAVVEEIINQLKAEELLEMSTADIMNAVAHISIGHVIDTIEKVFDYGSTNKN